MTEAIEIGGTYTFYCEVQQEYEPPDQRLRRFTGTAVIVLSKDTDRDDEAGEGYIVRAEDGTVFGAHAEELNGWDFAQDQFFWPDGRYGRDRSDRFLVNEGTA